MGNAHRDSPYFVFLGIAAFLLIGSALENAAPVSTVAGLNAQVFPVPLILLVVGVSYL